MADTAAVPDRTKKSGDKKQKKDKPSQKPAQKPAQKSKAELDTKGITVKKEDDLAEWYQQVLSKGQFISYYDVSGCYILEPASYAIWENIQDYFNAKIKSIGVRNCYYPLFISQANLEKEKDHVGIFWMISIANGIRSKDLPQKSPG
jgi:prolyl-tRNA synthetase